MTAIRVELELDSGQFTTRMLHAGETVQQFNRNVGQGYTSISRLTDASGTFLSTLRDVTVILGQARQAFQLLRQVTTGIAEDIVKVNAEMERLGVLLAGMSTKANPVKEVADQIKYLRDFAKSAPFSLKGLSDTFVKMKATGIDPMAGAFKSLVDGVAAFGGTEETLKRATIAVTQMAGKGVIQMEELRQQLGEAVPRAVELMARSMGTSMGDLIQKISKGTVESKGALAALFSELNRTFGGAAAQQMTTFNGLLSQARTLFENLALEAGSSGFFNTLKQQLKDLNAFLGSDNAAAYARRFGSALETVVLYARAAVDKAIEFRNEIMRVGEVLLYAFGARVAVAAFTSLTGAIGGVIVQIRAMSVAWQAAQRAMMVNNFEMLAGQMGMAGVGISRFTGVVRGAGIVLGGLGAIAGSTLGWAIPLAAAVMAAAAAFGLFSNKAKDAYESLVKYGAESRKQVMEAGGYLTQLETKLAAAQKEANYKFEKNTLRFQRTPETKKRWEDYYGVTELKQTIAEVRQTLADAAIKAEKEDSQKIVRTRLESVDEQVQAISKAYDQEGILRAKNFDETVKEYQKNKKDTEKIRLEYEQWTRERALRFYDDQIALIEEQLHNSRIMMEAGSEDEKRIFEALQSKLLEREKFYMEQRENVRKQASGVPVLEKPTNIDKLLERAGGMLDNVNAKIAEQKAELAGVSGEYAKLVYMLEQAQSDNKRFPIDNDRVRAVIEDLKKAQAEWDKYYEAASGQTKLNRELERLYNKAQTDVFEQQTRGMSDLDKLNFAIKNGMYSGLKPTSLMQQMWAGVSESAKAAGASMSEALSDQIRQKGISLTDVVRALNGEWTGFRRNVEGTNIGDKLSAGGSGRTFSTFDGGSFLNNLIRRESSGKTDAVNGRAVGLGQFMEGTWLDFLKALHPEMLDAGRQAALDTRKDGALMKEAIIWYAAQNAGKLGNKGIDVNDANLYLAHFLGPDGAIAALTKSSDTLLSAIPQLNRARAQNPGVFNDLLTVGDLKSWSQSFMGSGMTAPVYKGGSRNMDELLSNLTPQQQSMAREIERLQQLSQKLGENNALGDKMKEYREEILKTTDAQAGLEKNVAKTKKAIREGAFSSVDKDPESQRYQGLIKLAQDLDKAQELAAERKKIRDRVNNFENGKESANEGLKAREDDIARRLENESSFKFSRQYFQQVAQLERAKQDIEKAQANGDLTPDRAAEHFADIEERKRRLRSIEVQDVIATEQIKTREIEKSLMSADEAREFSFGLEVKRLRDLLALSETSGEERAKIEEILQKKIQLYRQQTDQATPLGQQMKGYRDLGNNLQKAAVGWLDSASDKLAEFAVKGKADFKGFADAIIMDMARIGIRATMASVAGGLGLTGGGAAKGGAAAKGGGAAKVATRHSGGFADGAGPHRLVDSSVFKNARRWHTGTFGRTLAGDEVPIIAKRGEQIDWPENLAKQYGGAGAIQSNVFNVTVNGSAGTPEQNKDLAAQVGRQLEAVAGQLVTKHIRTQMRPGGLLSGKK